MCADEGMVFCKSIQVIWVRESVLEILITDLWASIPKTMEKYKKFSSMI